jgi:hypothetical protein
MIPKDLPQDLEAFQRWGMVIDDELSDAVNAVIAFEDPDAECVNKSRDVLGSDTDTSDLAEDLVKEISAFRENSDRPRWFTPEFQMLLVVSTWFEFLRDYIDEQQTRPANFARSKLVIEKALPALEHYGRWLDALRTAGYFPEDEAGRTPTQAPSHD